MIKVSFWTKTRKGIIDVKCSESLKKTNSYESFIDNIAKTFSIKNKDKIILKVLTNDEDEQKINDQQDFDDFLDEAKEFKVFLEDDDDNIEYDKEDSEREGDMDDVVDDDDDLKIPSDKEIENTIERQFKPIPDINYNLEEEFNKEKYIKELNEKYTKYKNDFKNCLEKEISIFSEKSQIIKSGISSALEEYSTSQIKELDNLNNEANTIKEGISVLVEDTKKMNEALKEINELPMPLPKPEIKIQVRFKKENIEKEELPKACNFIDINDIEIHKISNNSFKNLILVRDKEKSSEDFVLLTNSKNDQSYKLTLNGILGPKDKGNYSITAKIKNPKENEQYKLYLNAREKVDGTILSKPLIITVKVKENENKKFELYEKLDEEFDLSLMKKGKVLEKIKELKYDEEAIKNWIKKKKKKLQKKIDEIFERLNKEFDLNSKKEEVLEKIKELNLDEEATRNWIKAQIEEEQQRKIEEIFERLNEEFDLNSKKEEVLEKIKELKCDEKAIKNWINQMKEEELQKKINELYEKLNKEIDLSSMEKEEVLEKIKELNLDEEAIKDWIQNNMEKDPAIEMFKKFNKKYDLNCVKEEVIKKIKELNYNEEEIKKWIEEVLKILNEEDQEINILSVKNRGEALKKIIEVNLDKDAINDWVF